MKTITKILLSLCILVGLGSTMSSQAQIESDITIKANIPHSFIVNKTTLPAGNYVVSVPDSSDLNVLEIRSANDKLSVLFETDPVNVTRTARQSELVFDRIGDTYFLAQVFLRGDEGGNQLMKSKKQERLEEGGVAATKHSIPASPAQAKASKQEARKTNQ